MATNPISTAGENKSESTDMKVTNETNETINNSVENKKDTVKDRDDKDPVNNSPPTTHDAATPVNKEEKSKTRFRKNNLYINVQEVNAFLDDKKQ